MSLIKGRVSDISDDFLERVKKTFPKDQAVYNPERHQSIEELAYLAGIQALITWMDTHANKTTSTG